MMARFYKNRRLWTLGAVLFVLAAVFLSSLIAMSRADAQTSPADVLKSLPPGTLQNLPPDLLQKLPPDVLDKLKKGNNPGTGDNSGASTQGVETLQPAPSPTVPKGDKNASRLEDIYSTRAGEPLEQFGYSVLGVPAAVTILQSGGVQDDYVLGIGDQLQFDLRGQENSSYTQTVDTSGRIVLPKIAPILAAGRTFAEFRRDLEQRVAEAYVSTKVFISLTTIRQASVLVSGAVRTPGVRIVSGLSTALDAILLSGGISKTGSLRNVKLIRGGTVQTIDLYSVIAQGTESNLGRLRDGDRIFVSQLGATVAISGSVRRPAIYELAAGTRAIPVRSLLALAGGVEIKGSYRILLLRTRPDGRQQFDDVTSSPGAVVGDGELLIVNSSANDTLGGVTLLGDVKVPGLYALGHVKTLHDLLPSAQALGQDAYLLLGIIVREDPATLHRIVVPFSPLHVIQGTENLDLISKDEVHILTVTDMRYVASSILSPAEAASAAAAQSTATNPLSSGSAASFPSAANGQSGPSLPSTLTPGASSSGAPATSTLPSSDGAISLASPGTMATGASAAGGMSQFSVTDQNFIGQVIGEYSVILSGAVRDPGIYLVMPGTTLDELVLAANGLDRDVDLSSVEITSREVDNVTGRSVTSRRTISATPEGLRDTKLGKYDQIVFRHVYSDLQGGQVTLRGEFRYPGTYGIIKGERLSSIIARAGGLTEVAYPLGAVYSRPSVADLERKGYARAAREVQEQLATLVATPTQGKAIDPQSLEFLAGLAVQLQNPPTIGRMAVVADPVVLAVNPSVDPILESGDSLYMPRRPSSVTVSGEVLNPGSFLFRSELGYRDYIRMAGGESEFANDGSTFVVYPDGTAVPVDADWLSFGNGGAIPPGSTIVVPRDLRPFSFDVFLRDAVQTFSILAIAAATVANVARSN
ncbi:MAG: SLBB domain-containing protein [Proteobacteria bacterium]|nr:SLBB domain-containing protein [Pseudomonadota bacterium]